MWTAEFKEVGLEQGDRLHVCMGSQVEIYFNFDAGKVVFSFADGKEITVMIESSEEGGRVSLGEINFNKLIRAEARFKNLPNLDLEEGDGIVLF